jgi:hypothetical protein
MQVGMGRKDSFVLAVLVIDGDGEYSTVAVAISLQGLANIAGCLLYALGFV